MFVKIDGKINSACYQYGGHTDTASIKPGGHFAVIRSEAERWMHFPTWQWSEAQGQDDPLVVTTEKNESPDLNIIEVICGVVVDLKHAVHARELKNLRDLEGFERRMAIFTTWENSLSHVQLSHIFTSYHWY